MRRRQPHTLHACAESLTCESTEVLPHEVAAEDDVQDGEAEQAQSSDAQSHHSAAPESNSKACVDWQNKTINKKQLGQWCRVCEENSVAGWKIAADLQQVRYQLACKPGLCGC